MLRRALATTKQFGMCVHIDNNEYANYGCMLEIKKAQFLRDGRAVVDTIGGRRFKVVRRNIKDGYCVADVEWLRDIKINNQEGILFKKFIVSLYTPYTNIRAEIILERKFKIFTYY
jgi:Lon protease-like protein